MKNNLKESIKYGYKYYLSQLKKFRLSYISSNQWIGIGIIISLLAIASNIAPISKESKLKNLCVKWGYIFKYYRGERGSDEPNEKLLSAYSEAIDKVTKKIINLGIKENFKFKSAYIYCGYLEKVN